MRNTSKNLNNKNLLHLKKIIYLAWNGIKKNKLYFNKNDLRDAGLSDKNIDCFTVAFKRESHETLLNVIKNATENCIYFSHLLLQEFFAAFYSLYFMGSVEFIAFFSHTAEKNVSLYKNNSNQKFDLNENRLEVITKFSFGLTNFNIFELLREFTQALPNPIIISSTLES